MSTNLILQERGRYEGIRIIQSMPGAREAIAHCMDGCRWAHAMRNAPFIATKPASHLAAERIGKWLATGRA